ncbi:zf-TFIIB domain-containing protein [Natronoarchaeum rubrum]|uniref:zf-TFIIB domain-containing protein n=1 Tax=Natronoarchaeum rubrum TaxID=755311 RepID=UPI002112F641|nr:zf-TFIIB domain-containing protein [Natronoarchaeum rubrum]
MDCPRCSGTLETYALFGREAEGCEKCGYVGVAVSHESKPDELESWQEALDRFKKSN